MVYQTSVLATLLRAEVALPLNSRCGRSASSSMGPAVPNVDFLGLAPPDVESVTYCVEASNMDCFDTLLGERWDIMETDSCTRFVTSLKIAVSPVPVYSLKVVVTYSRYDGHLRKANYRKQLADHLGPDSI